MTLNFPHRQAYNSVDHDGHPSYYFGSCFSFTRYRHLFLAETREYITNHRTAAAPQSQWPVF